MEHTNVKILAISDVPSKALWDYDTRARLEGIDCRGKGTSCPDQLAKALRLAL